MSRILTAALIGMFLLGGRGNAVPWHDCLTYCDANCRAAIEGMHQGDYQTPKNCSNGAPGTGAQANWCSWDYVGNGSGAYVLQACGNNYDGAGSNGCGATGSLKCPKPGGGYAYPDYTFTCAVNGIYGGAPVQSVDESGGVCTWPNGVGAFMACSSTGGVSFGIW